MSGKEESLEEFARRIASEMNSSPIESLAPNAALMGLAAKIAEAAKAFCHYENGGSSFNSCCQHSYRCREAAEAGAAVRWGKKTVEARPLPIRLPEPPGPGPGELLNPNPNWPHTGKTA